MYFYSHPLIQISLLTAINILFLVYLIISHTFKNKFSQIIIILN